MATNGVNPHNLGLANLFSSSVGSSGIGRFMRGMGQVYPIYTGSVFGGMMGGCFGYMGSGFGLWNAQLDNYSFSGVVKDRNKVGFWGAFSAGFKEQLYVNPMGSLMAGLGLLGVGANMVGGISNALAGIGQNNKNIG